MDVTKATITGMRKLLATNSQMEIRRKTMKNNDEPSMVTLIVFFISLVIGNVVGHFIWIWLGLAPVGR